MIIYNVTCSIDSDIVEDWLDWMKKTHIPDILDTGFFIRATINTVPAILRWCQLAKISGLLFINHTPPPAYLKPTLSKLIPIINTTIPVTNGGNI